MSPLARSLLALACAALLRASCAAVRRRPAQRPHSLLRLGSSTSVTLGDTNGSDIVVLPEIHIDLADTVVGFPESNCSLHGKYLVGTEAIFKNTDSRGQPPQIVVDDFDDPLSQVTLGCGIEPDGSRCPQGIDLVTYQYCSFFGGDGQRKRLRGWAS